MKMQIALLFGAALALGACTHEQPVSQVVPAAPAAAYHADYTWFESDRGPADDAEKAAKCAARVEAAGCGLSGNDAERIVNGVADCKQFQSKGGGKIEVFLLNESGSLVTVNEGAATPALQHCARAKFSLGTNIAEIKVLVGRIFARGEDGRLFTMQADGRFSEILNASGQSYQISDMKGAPQNNQQIVLKGRANNTWSLDMNDLDRKMMNGQTRPIRFNYLHSMRSLFRDEDPRY
jgi:hypothetical protein